MNANLREQIIKSLQEVIDPETNVDVMRMRLVQDLDVDEAGVVRYTFSPSSPLCPLAVTLILQIKKQVAGVPGVTGQEIHVEGYVDAAGLEELVNVM